MVHNSASLAVFVICCAGGALQAQRVFPLKVEAAVQSVEFCRADSEIGLLKLIVKLRFENTAANPIALHRGAGVIRSALVAPELKDLLSRKYQHEYSFTTLFAGSVASGDRATKRILILKAGDTHEVDEPGWLPVWLEPTTSRPSHLKPGKYFVSFVLSMWPEGSAARTGEEAGSDTGPLMPAPELRTAPILIEVPSGEPTKNCTSPSRSPAPDPMVAVGTAVTDRPPHRSVRAELPHTAPA
jgi:hypothetical protein